MSSENRRLTQVEQNEEEKSLDKIRVDLHRGIVRLNDDPDDELSIPRQSQDTVFEWIRKMSESSSSQIEFVDDVKNIPQSPSLLEIAKQTMNDSRRNHRRPLSGLAFMITGFSKSSGPSTLQIQRTIQNLGGRIYRTYYSIEVVADSVRSTILV